MRCARRITRARRRRRSCVGSCSQATTRRMMMTRERTCDLDHEPLRRELRENQISHGQCPACDQDLSDNEGDVAARILFIDRYYAGKSPADANGLVWTYRNWMNPLRSSLHNYEGYDWTSGAYHQIIA